MACLLRGFLFSTECQLEQSVLFIKVWRVARTRIRKPPPGQITFRLEMIADVVVRQADRQTSSRSRVISATHWFAAAVK